MIPAILSKRYPVLETPRLWLGLPKASQVSAVVDYFVRNQEHLAAWEPVRPPEFFTESFWKKQIRGTVDEFRNESSAKFFLVSKQDPDQVIGCANLSNLVRGVAQYCNMGYSLDQAWQGRGYMQEALVALVVFGFDQLHLHRIMANYMPHNQKSGAVLKHLGFQVEGYARNYLKIAGTWQDHVLTALENPDFSE